MCAAAGCAKPWWTSAVEFLALPAAILAIVFQLTQTTGNIHTQEKDAAETAKFRVEELKTRAELEKVLDDLAQTKDKGVTAYREELEKSLPKLQQTIEQLKALESRSAGFTLERGIANVYRALAPYVSLSFRSAMDL